MSSIQGVSFFHFNQHCRSWQNQESRREMTRGTIISLCWRQRDCNFAMLTRSTCDGVSDGLRCGFPLICPIYGRAWTDWYDPLLICHSNAVNDSLQILPASQTKLPITTLQSSKFPTQQIFRPKAERWYWPRDWGMPGDDSKRDGQSELRGFTINMIGCSAIARPGESGNLCPCLKSDQSM